MNPILALTFGLSVGDLHSIWRGGRNEIIGIILTFAVGCIVGIFGVIGFGDDYRSTEIDSRGEGTVWLIR